MSKLMLFVMVAFLACAGMVLAQTDQTSQPPTSSPSTSSPNDTNVQVNTPSMNGTIQSVDSAKKTITIRDANGNTTKVYTYADSTSFKKGDSTITITDLKPGDQITFVSNDQNDLSSVTIESPNGSSSTTTVPPQQH
jgi:Cu/Ag efflux protein CusF